MTLAPAPDPAVAGASRDARRRRLAGLLAVAFAVSSVGLLAAPRPADAWSAGSFSSTSEKQLVSLTNRSRAAAGLRALKVDSALTSIARWRSKDMITRNYFSHNIPPAGYNVFHVLDQKHYCYAIAGENIGWNNYPDDIATGVVHNSFMQLARPPLEHPQQALGRHRRSAPTRARPARRCGPSSSPTSAARTKSSG